MAETDVRPWHFPPNCRNEFCPFCHASLHLNTNRTQSVVCVETIC
jgi:hypothetical protein